MDLDTAIARLVELARRLGLPDDAFDDDVYDLAGDDSLDKLNDEKTEAGQEAVVTTFEQSASTINNGGFGAQFRFLLTSHATIESGFREIESEIRKRVG